MKVNRSKRIAAKPITRAYIHTLRGVMKGTGALKILEEERIPDPQSIHFTWRNLL